MFLTLALVAVATLCVYLYLTRNFNYWQNQNVPCAEYPIPGFGHTLPLFLVRENMGMWAEKFYRKMGKRSMYGCYYMQTPTIVIRDPALVKMVMQTNFSSFRNNKTSVNDDLDVIMKKNPFFAKDEQWRESRLMLGNNFSAKTLRGVFDIVLRVSGKFKNFLDEHMDDGGSAEMELKGLIARVAGEAIANAAFGIEGQSFQVPTPKHAFINFARDFFEATPINGFERVVRFSFPNVAKLTGMRMMSKDTDFYFRKIMKTIINSRLENKEIKSDFLHYIIERMDEIDEDMAVAQATALFFDGYETTSSVISSIVHHLARFPEIQDKARQEVVSVLEKFDGQLSYDAIKNLTYLEQIMFESLRLNPAGIEFARVCNETTTLRGYDGLTCQLQPGHLVLISAVGLHMDEEYWPNPTVFDPDRFSESKESTNKYTFLPFGEGPRNCIGKRLGIIMVKVVTATILLNYSIKHSSRTKLPIRLNPGSFTWVAEGGLWVHFKKLMA